MAQLIAISTGDITGIGPEVTLKALDAELCADNTRYVLFGDEARLRSLNAPLGLKLHDEATAPADARIIIAGSSVPPLPSQLDHGSKPAADAAVKWLDSAARLCLSGKAHGVVTAPVNKAAIIRAGHPFIGQTEYLAALAGVEDAVMMLLGTDDHGRWLRVALATTHVPLREVPGTLTALAVARAVDQAVSACRKLGLPTARIGVCGLNPHAGENGNLGVEEQTIIDPVIQAARGKGCDVSGPWPADSLFYHALRGAYDVVVAMYHDQGLAPLKLVAFETGVNWTLGLPFARTSPDHGTAYDIAGQGKANPSSMIAALRLARRLASGGG